MAWPLRRYFRLLWWTLCLLTFLALPLTIWEFQKQRYDVHYQAWFIGGIFVILSMPISIYEIAMHTEYYTQPRLQKHVIRILLMVPIYAVDAWFALRFRKAREYLDPIRECYEAFVIYSFFAYLMAFLQDQLGDLDEHMSRKPQMEHVWGVRWLLRPWDMGTRFLWECKKGVLNYVIIRPLCTSLAFITDIFDKYGEGQINFKKSYVYLAAATNFSQLWALYCLVMLYTAMHNELAPIRPLSKFLCIKAVVFVTFWQGIAIAILVYAGVIRKDSWTGPERLDVAAGIQDFLICIEMFLAALAHAYAFPPRDYMAGHSKGFFSNVRYIFDLRDVVDDVGLVVEEHVSSATTAVVKVPQRAVKKAAQGLAKNTKKLFGGSSRGSNKLLEEEEEEAASKCALLNPTGSSGGGDRRRSSSGGGGLGEGGSGPYGSGGSQSRELLMAPPQHLMMSDMEPVMSVSLTAGRESASTGRTSTSYLPMPPLAPVAATLTGGGGSGGAFSTLLTSALYPSRGGHEHGGAGGNRMGQVGSGGMEEPSGGPSETGPYVELGEHGGAAPSSAGPSGSFGSFSGGEVPLAAVGQNISQHGRVAAGVGLEGSGRRGSGGGSGGSGGSGSSRSRGKGDVSARGAGRGGASSGEDSPYEKLPMLPTPKRGGHEE